MRPIVYIKRRIAAQLTTLETFDAGREGFDGYDDPGNVLASDPGTTGRRLLFNTCPGCGRIGVLSIVPTITGPQQWSVAAGNLDDPTSLSLSPSIFHNVPECGWHGYLTSGVFEPC